MARQWDIRRLIGLRVVDRNGVRVGVVGQIYFDDRTGAPRWMMVRRGLLRAAARFVPMHGARVRDRDVQAPFTKETIRAAPLVPAGRHLAVDQEDRVSTHYERSDRTPPAPRETPDPRSYFVPRGRHAKPSRLVAPFVRLRARMSPSRR